MGVCTWEKCPQTRDSVHLARDTAIFQFQPARHVWGPNEPILGPTDTVSGPHGFKHGQKATQSVLKLILFINLDNGTILGRSTEAPGPVFGDFGLFWARLGPHQGPTLGTATGALWHFGTLATATRAFRVPNLIVYRPNTIPDSVVTFFLRFWEPCCSGARQGPCRARGRRDS